MLVRERVIQALEQQAGSFRGYQLAQHHDLDQCRQFLLEIAGWPSRRLADALAGMPAPGALPTAEHDAAGGAVIPFRTQWKNHEQARQWAMQVLMGRTTFAVDGSHIPPQRTMSIPVALIQIGWYENRHQPGGAYEKDVMVEVLPPAELGAGAGADLEQGWDERISLRRYVREVERVIAYMQGHAGEDPPPVVFFDGSLIASFAGRLSLEVQNAYASHTMRMVMASEDTGVPLIGYIDTSYARDMVEMLRSAGGVCAGHLSDPILYAPLMRWGDRTPAYICARDDVVLSSYVDEASGRDFRRRICFTYLKTTADHPPARIEFPLWLLEAGRLDEVMDIVRAETVVGNGYPYPLETADAVAVLTMEDRERFYELFRQFAQRHDLPLRVSRKLLSKQQRRV
jgi:hypothetical protein